MLGAMPTLAWACVRRQVRMITIRFFADSIRRSRYNGGSETARYFYHRDGLGSVIALSQLNGSTVEIVESYSYDIHGRTTIMNSAGTDGKWMTPDVTSPAASALGNPYLFTGRRYDPETRSAGHPGLYYFRARYYHPDLMRFLQPDPVGYADSMNLYEYVGNNPLGFIDPYGLSRWSDMWSYMRGGSWISRDDFVDYAYDVKESFIGVGEGLVDVGKGTVNSVFHPVQTAKGVWGAATHPIETVKGLKETLSQKVSQFLGDDPRAAGRVIGQAAGQAAMSAVGAKAGGIIKAKLGCPVKRMFGKLGCFTAGTLIATPEGLVPIERIKAGDWVWAYDPDTDEVLICQVARTFVRQVNGLVLVEAGEEVIETTAEHPFWVVGSGWIPAKDLQPGFMLQTLEGDILPIDDVCLRPGPITVYNFEVEDAHDYFVSIEAILVHNTTCPGRLGKQARLRGLIDDSSLSSADRGWLRQEMNSIARGQRRNIRVPPGKELAHMRGFEARKGFSYAYSNLQEKSLHRLQHKIGGY
ncbi:MAG: Hint domain-containing protein [Sedimentisphaerales bacterium]|nr:Hint domain-containing protein [Sedimentisphaerales bacterium]